MMPQNIQLDNLGRLRHLLTIEGLKRQTIVDILDTAESFTSVAGQAVKKVPFLRGKTTVYFLNPVPAH